MIWLALELWPYLLLSAVLGAGVVTVLTTVGGTTEQWVDEAPGALAAALLQAGATDLASGVRSQPAVVSPSGLPPTDPPDGGTSGWAGELGGARAARLPARLSLPALVGQRPRALGAGGGVVAAGADPRRARRRLPVRHACGGPAPTPLSATRSQDSAWPGGTRHTRPKP